MKKLLLTFLLVMSFAPALAYAQNTSVTPTPFCTNGVCTYTPLEPLPGQPAATQGGLTFAQYLSNIFTISIVIGAMVAVVMLIISGITYMMSEALPTKDWGKRKAKQSLWALLILLGAYLILFTINPNLVNFTTSTLGSGAQAINPLQPCNFIVEAGGTAVQSCSTASQYPSAASLNALPSCNGQNPYPNGALTPVCQ